MTIPSLIRNLGAMAAAGRLPSRRSLAALAKVHGRRLERRWPFLPRAEGRHLNLQLEDALELQFARRRLCWVMVVGAFDGVQNDPVARFALRHDCRGIFVEPQPAAFERLKANLGAHAGFHFVQAAVDAVEGRRTLYQVAPDGSLPDWTAQLASFSPEHIIKHEDRVPGLSRHIVETPVRTVTFEGLLRRFQLRSLDVLQIDAEGLDAQLLAWFPFDTLRPGLVHYETAHMARSDLAATHKRLQAHGYRVYPTESGADEMAIRV